MATRLVIVVKRGTNCSGTEGWRVGTPSEVRTKYSSSWCRIKRGAVNQGVCWCVAHAEAGGRAQLRVYGPRGLQYERTYPRSSDPRRSRG